MHRTRRKESAKTVAIVYTIVYVSVLTASFLTGLVPERIGHASAWLFGSIFYALMPARRRVMAANYSPVLGLAPDDPRVRRIGRLSYRNFVRYLFDFLALPHRSVEEIDARVDLRIGDDFAAARAAGKGVIFVSAHFGNMDYAGIAAARHIAPVTVVADMLQPKKLMDRLVEFRGKKGLRIVYLSQAPRAILQALKRNEAVGFLLDVGCKRPGGIPVTFFGRRTMFPAGPALLALRTGAPIIVGYGLVVGDRIEVYSYPPIFATSTGHKDDDARNCSQMVVQYFEDFIRRHPEQWYIYRPMWGAETTAQPQSDQPLDVKLPEAAPEAV